MAKDMKDSHTLDLLEPGKKRGRPRSNPLDRKEQMRLAQQRYRDNQKKKDIVITSSESDETRELQKEIEALRVENWRLQRIINDQALTVHMATRPQGKEHSWTYSKLTALLREFIRWRGPKPEDSQEMNDSRYLRNLGAMYFWAETTEGWRDNGDAEEIATLINATFGIQ